MSGAGNVGATCAQELARRDYADVVLVDIKEGLPQGKALDINQAAAVLGYEANVTGSNGYDESAGSEVVVITAGLPRQPGMSRDDLVTTNEKIVKSVTEQVIAASPDAILVIVSNPLDAMCHVAKNVSAWPKERVFGMAGILDTARFSAFIAWETGMSIKDVTAMVLGGHGDQMVPVVSATTVGGIPLRKLAPEDRIQAMVERTAKGGGELVNLLGTSAWYAPGAAAAQMVDAVVLDEKRVLPCTAYLEGEYGIDGLYMGVPVVLGAGGIERIVELDLDDAEQQALKASADAVREVVGVLTTVDMDLDLRGRTAIVCGASAGIGLGCAESLAEAGANVVMFARRQDVLEREAERVGGVPVTGDVTSADDLERLVSTAVERFGGVDVVVLNSGGPPRTKALDATDEQVERRRTAAPARADQARPPLPPAPRGERPWARHCDHLERGQGTGRQSRPLEWCAPGARRLAQGRRTRARPGRRDRELRRARTHRHRADQGGLSRRPDGRRPRDDPAAAPRHAPRGGRRRLLPRVRSRWLRLRHDDRSRRRPDAEPAVKPLRLVALGRRARS